MRTISVAGVGPTPVVAVESASTMVSLWSRQTMVKHDISGVTYKVERAKWPEVADGEEMWKATATIPVEE